MSERKMSSKVDKSNSSCTPDVVDENFVNIPEIWPQLASSLVNSICNGPGQYIPVSRLRSKNEAYLPLQVFFDATSLVTGSVLRLDESQERVLTRKTAESSLMSRVQNSLGLKFRRIRNQGSASSQDDTPATCRVHLREQYRGTNDGIGFTLDQRIRRWRSPHPKDLDDDHHGVRMRQDGRFHFKFGGIYYRSIAPHTLLDCRLPPASPIRRMKVKKFYIIYDTCLARQIQCTVNCKTASDGQPMELEGDKERVVRLQDCPIAFRCLQATVDDNGIIVDLRFHVGEREVTSFDRKVNYAILSPQMLINMKVPS